MAMRGFNAYSQFTTIVKDSVKQRDLSAEQSNRHDKPGSLYSEPVDTVTISRTARSLSFSLTTERETAQTALRDWIKESGSMNGVVSHRASGQTMAELLSANGITLDEDESYDINIDVWCAVTVTGKNAEKAKAIQNLLNSTPSGINWGFLLQKLPDGF